jgi:multiple sugar transport system permease protein
MSVSLTRPGYDLKRSATRRDPATLAIGGRPSWLSTAILLIGALYCLMPVVWVLIASTKNRAELFSTNTFVPSAHLWTNIVDLSQFSGGVYWRWMLNTAIYAGGGALLSVFVSALAGYALAKYEFAGKGAIFMTLLAGVLVPGVILAIPQYFLFAKFGLTNSYESVILPQIVSPYGIYLARIYAAASIPNEVIEAARTEGAGEFFIFRKIATPLMVPGLVTIFLFQFVGVWNNFMLPYVMLGNDKLFPLTVGLYTLLNQGSSAPALYTYVVTGSLLSIAPLIVLFLTLQRYWRVDLGAGAVK